MSLYSYPFCYFLLHEIELIVSSIFLQDWTGFNFREIMDDVEKIKGTVYSTVIKHKKSLTNFLWPFTFCIFLLSLN